MEDYDTLCDELSSKYEMYFECIRDRLLIYLDPLLYPAAIVNWACNKKTGIFQCGLNKASSSIGSSMWESIEAHTNACEQTHYKSNAFGRWLPLLRAIQ